MSELPPEHPNRPREYHGPRTLLAGLAVVAIIAVALWLIFLRGGGGQPAATGVVPLPPELQTAGREIGPRIGQLAPDFELDTLDGGRLRLSDLRGQPLVLNFWASWCSPCRREVPALIRAQNRHADAGLLIIGLNIEEPPAAAQDFVDEFGVEFPIPMDRDGAVYRAYGYEGLVGPPRTFFVDADGIITKIYAGQAPDAQIAADIAAHASRPP